MPVTFFKKSVKKLRHSGRKKSLLSKIRRLDCLVKNPRLYNSNGAAKTTDILFYFVLSITLNWQGVVLHLVSSIAYVQSSAVFSDKT